MNPSVPNMEALLALKNHEDGEIIFVSDLKQDYCYVAETDEWVIYYPEEVSYSEETDSSGTNLYQLNKLLVGGMPDCPPEKIQDLKKEIRTFVNDNQANVYMLLCHDLRYYTVFLKNEEYEENIEDIVVECIEYFGNIKSIEYNTEEKIIEIWFIYEDEPFVA